MGILVWYDRSGEILRDVVMVETMVIDISILLMITDHWSVLLLVMMCRSRRKWLKVHIPSTQRFDSPLWTGERRRLVAFCHQPSFMHRTTSWVDLHEDAFDQIRNEQLVDLIVLAGLCPEASHIDGIFGRQKERKMEGRLTQASHLFFCRFRATREMLEWTTHWTASWIKGKPEPWWPSLWSGNSLGPWKLVITWVPALSLWVARAGAVGLDLACSPVSALTEWVYPVRIWCRIRETAMACFFFFFWDQDIWACVQPPATTGKRSNGRPAIALFRRFMRLQAMRKTSIFCLVVRPAADGPAKFSLELIGNWIRRAVATPNRTQYHKAFLLLTLLSNNSVSILNLFSLHPQAPNWETRIKA